MERAFYGVNCAAKISHVNFSLSHAGGEKLKVVENAGLPFAEDRREQHGVSAQDLSPSGTIVVEMAPPSEQEVVYEEQEDGSALIYARLETEPKPALLRAEPTSVRLIWDVSRSGKRREIDRELAFLDQWFKTMGAVKVSLTLLRHEVVAGGQVIVENGNWDRLRQKVEALSYDGATRFDLLDLESVKEDLVLLVSDGVSPFALPAQCARPLLLLDAGPSAAATSHRTLARESGGDYIDLLAMSVDEAVAKAQLFSPRIEVDGALKDVFVDFSEGQGGEEPLLRVIGSLPAGTEDSLEIEGDGPAAGEPE